MHVIHAGILYKKHEVMASQNVKNLKYGEEILILTA